MMGRTSQKMWNTRKMYLSMHPETSVNYKKYGVQVNCSCYRNVTTRTNCWGIKECVDWCTGCSYYIAMEHQINPFRFVNSYGKNFGYIVSLNKMFDQKKTTNVCIDPFVGDNALNQMIMSTFEHSKFDLLIDLIDYISPDKLISLIHFYGIDNSLVIINIILDNIDDASDLAPQILPILFGYTDGLTKNLKDHRKHKLCKMCGIRTKDSIGYTICVDTAMNLPPIRGYKVVMERSETAYFCGTNRKNDGCCFVDYLCSFIEDDEASALVHRIFDTDGKNKIVSYGSYGDINVRR
jgi:hypothetical protein